MPRQTLQADAIDAVKTLTKIHLSILLGARTRPGLDVSYENGAIPIKLAVQEEHVYAVVPSAESEAKKHGRDLMFVECSRGCVAELEKFLRNGIASGNNVRRNW